VQGGGCQDGAPQVRRAAHVSLAHELLERRKASVTETKMQLRELLRLVCLNHEIVIVCIDGARIPSAPRLLGRSSEILGRGSAGQGGLCCIETVAEGGCHAVGGAKRSGREV
jgi:hypothetical protein